MANNEALKALRNVIEREQDRITLVHRTASEETRRHLERMLNETKLAMAAVIDMENEAYAG